MILVPKTKLFITSGYPLQNVTEVYDWPMRLTDWALECEQSIGIARYGAVGGLLDDEYMVICGGKDGQHQFKNCLSRNLRHGNTTTIEMADSRYGAAGINLNDSMLWIVGGSNQNSNLKTTEFIDLNHGTSPGPSLPFTVKNHCMVLLDENTVFIIGGIQDGITTNQVWIADPNETTVRPGVSMIENRKMHSCARFTKGEVLFVMVVGGKNGIGEPFSVGETYNVDLKKWIKGKIESVQRVVEFRGSCGLINVFLLRAISNFKNV